MNSRIATPTRASVATPATSATTSNGVRTQGVFGDLAAGAGAIVGFALGGPASIVGGAVVGYLVGSSAEIFLHYREMNQAEWDFANRVFKGTLPARNQIIITSMARPGNRAFVLPSWQLSQLPLFINPAIAALALAEGSLARGRYLVNMGTDWERPSVTNPSIFIHELTHVWQALHAPWIPFFLCQGFFNGLRDLLGQGNDVYYGNNLGKQFRDYNLEQQAVLVAMWAESFSKLQPSQRIPSLDGYIRDNIWAGNPNAQSSPIAIGSEIIGSQGSNVSIPRRPTGLI